LSPTTELCKTPGQCDVVVIEDDKLLAMVLAMQLETAGINFCAGSDGHQALALMKAHHPKILLLDVTLPGLSGFDVVEAIRQDPNFPDLNNVNLIVHTSHDLTDEEKARLTLGRTLFMTKTTMSTELSHIVKALLSGSEREVDSIFDDRPNTQTK